MPSLPAANRYGVTCLETCHRTKGTVLMNISHPISTLSPPAPGARVPNVTFSYINARNRRRAFGLLMREFRKSGITRAELAIRTGKSKAQISRLLGQPRNLTMDTLGELLFAISGKELDYGGADPFKHQVCQHDHHDLVYVAPQQLKLTPGGVVFDHAPIGAPGAMIVPHEIENIKAMAA